MVESNHDQAKKFLGHITPEDNIALITDHDPDGFTSGTLFFDYILARGAKATQFTFVRGISGPDNFDLEQFSKIITTDLPASQIGSTLHKYSNKPTFFMDHHPKDAELPQHVVEYRTLDRGYIPSARSAFELAGGKAWIALTGVVCDMGHMYKENDAFIAELCKKINIPLDDFKGRVAYKISNMILYLDAEPKKAFSLVQNLKSIDDVASLEQYSKPIEEEVEKWVVDYEANKEEINGVLFYYFAPNLEVKPIVTARISTLPKNKDKIFLFAAPKDENKISISARSQTRRMNMADLCKAGISSLEGASAGGHFAASGATIQKEDLDKFKENIRKYLQENPVK